MRHCRKFSLATAPPRIEPGTPEMATKTSVQATRPRRSSKYINEKLIAKIFLLLVICSNSFIVAIISIIAQKKNVEIGGALILLKILLTITFTS